MSTNPSRIQRAPLQQPTSREAWRDHDPTTVDGKMLAYLAEVDGATDYEMQQALGIISSTQSGNRRHLVERGLVYASDDRRLTPRGTEAIVWRLNEGAHRGPQVPAYVPPNDSEGQGRLFEPGPASAKLRPRNAYDL